MLPLPTETTIEEKTMLVRTMPSQVPVKINASRHIMNPDSAEETGRYGMVRSHWMNDIHYNRNDLSFMFETATRCPISFEFWTSRALLCWLKKGLSRSKNKYKSMAISEATDWW